VQAVLELVEPGMRLGLGSGRAVWAVADALGQSAAQPELVLCASPETARRAAASGLRVAGPDEAPELDLAIDGADEVMPDLAALKGGGGSLLREKLVLTCARQCVLVAESHKLVERLGARTRLPVEVVRFGWQGTRTRLLEVLDDAERRSDGEGAPFVTDEGHCILDCAIPPAVELAALAGSVKAITGVVEHGLFLEQAGTVLLGAPDGSLRRLVRP
jgi:ribose 5-phosphate isomerase A